MSSQSPSAPESQNLNENVFARIAALLPIESQPRFWIFINDWASRASPSDRLFLIVEGLAYMFMSLHDIPGALEKFQLAMKQEVRDSEQAFKNVRENMVATSGNCALELHKATKALFSERQRYDQCLQDGFKTLSEKLELKVSTLPGALAYAVMSELRRWIKDHMQELIFYGAIILGGLLSLSFYLGYRCGRGH